MTQDFVTVGTFTSGMEAHLGKNLLEREGVRAFIADELTGDQFSAAHVDGYVKLQVAREDAERAQQILEARKQTGSGS